MKYTKPEINEVTTALEAIQSDQVKAIHHFFDGTMTFAASPAYEADE